MKSKKTGYDRKDRDMNRKEAITHIDAMINTAIIVKGIVPDEYDMEALRMAVDALSGESKALPSAEPPTGELISRADAIEMAVDVETPQGTYERAIYVDDLMALPSAEAKATMTEEVREALMRLVMCAREECDMCKYKDKCGFEFQYNISTENMHTILDALSAEATCETCADRASCIMSAPDGKWKACKDYRLQVETVHKPDYSYEADMVRRLKESLSAEAEPTVIRCKTLLNAEDFEAVATRIRKENRNVIVIPCETEVASAEAVQGWIPCSERSPKVGKDVLLSFTDNQCVGGRYICDDGEEIWTVNSGGGWCTPIIDGDEEPTAWMPLPKPYKQKTERRG